MSQSDKGVLFKALKQAGVEFEKHYREYNTQELQDAYDELLAQIGVDAMPPLTPAEEVPEPPPVKDRGIKLPPIAPRDPEEMAGVRQNTQPEDEPIRVDPDTGYIWYQEEVQKAGYAKPRGRRVLKYMETGTVVETAQNGEYSETFEVSGDKEIPSEVKVTLPSFQVGIYKDPRHPFKTHVYNSMLGFDLFEVEQFYGGSDRIPEDVKRVYVENVLCYDIRTVIRDIETEYRRLQLTGRA